MDKDRELLVKYTRNRIALKAINAAIKKLLVDEDGDFLDTDITPFRDAWYDQDYAWEGWEMAVNDGDDSATDEQKELAKLLDKKAKNRVEAGQIKRSIHAAGRRLMRAETANNPNNNKERMS